MGTLLKYEFRRSRIVFLSIIGITLFFEILYLIGWFFQINALFAAGLIGGIIWIALSATAILLYGVIMFNEDISKRSGYLLFSTPRSARQIVGAKLLITFLALVGTSILFIAIIGVDVVFALKRSGQSLISLLAIFDQSITQSGIKEVLFTPYNIVGFLMYILTAIVSFLFNVIVAYLIITSLKTIMGNQKGRTILGIIAWFLITNIIGSIGGFISTALLNGNIISFEQTYQINPYSVTDTLSSLLNILFHPALYLPSLIITMICGIIGFWCTSWLMEKKMSL